MKHTLIIFILFFGKFSFGQVQGWLKNAQPVTEKNIEKIEKKGDKYIERFKNYPENTLEKDIYYRVKYIDYLKRLESFQNELNLIQDSLKPSPFPLVVIKDFDTKIVSKNETVRIESDTLINIIDIFEDSYSDENLPINEFRDYRKYKFIIENTDKTKTYVLENSYKSNELKEYPKFSNWLDKYLLYSVKKRKEIELEKQKKYELEQAEKEEKTKALNEIARITTCNTTIDDFTGEKSTFTNQQRLVLIENETVKSRANELWDKGIYVDYEMFVFAIKTIKKGKNTMIDVYLKHKTDRPLDFYGLIRKGETIDFKLENGKVINLKFLQSSTPEINFKYKYSYYENILDLTFKDVEELKKSAVKKVRINYTKGYKDYEVNDENLLIRQLECVTK